MAEIVVIGGANIDIKAKTVEANHLGTSNPGIIHTSPGGVGRNIAHNLAKLGAGVSLISVVGEDPYGAAVLEATAKAGVDVSRVERCNVATGTYVAVIHNDGELLTAINDMRAVDLITPDVIAQHAHAIAGAKLVVADCNLPAETLKALAGLAAGKLLIEPVSVPKSRKLLEVLKVSPVFMATPNFDQIESLTGSRDIVAGFEFMHGRGLRNVVIHAGPEGAFVSDGKDIDHVPIRPSGPVVDVTGAGDAAVAGLVFGLLKGQTLAAAAARGQELAGRVITGAKSTLD